MTTLREGLRRLIERLASESTVAGDEPYPDFAYMIYWTKQVRSWAQAQRVLVQRRVLEVVSAEDFTANRYLRKYRVPELDDLAHAGASLTALLRVLDAFLETQSTEGSEVDQ